MKKECILAGHNYFDFKKGIGSIRSLRYTRMAVQKSIIGHPKKDKKGLQRLQTLPRTEIVKPIK
jgi:hypothetical protein